MLEIRYYLAPDGRARSKAGSRPGCAGGSKVTVAIARLEQGNLSNVKGRRGGGARIPDRFRARIPGVFRARRGELVILLTGGTKKRQQRDIEVAIESVGGLQTAAQAGGPMKGGENGLTRELQGTGAAADRARPAFGEALLREGIDTMLAGDVDTGKAILRDYIKATIGFEKLGEATGTRPKSLIRMFGPRGNPQARNLFGVHRLPSEAGRASNCT